MIGPEGVDELSLGAIQLKAYEEAIDQALAKIRDPGNKLYRIAGYERFNDYLAGRWGLSGAKARR